MGPDRPWRELFTLTALDVCAAVFGELSHMRSHCSSTRSIVKPSSSLFVLPHRPHDCPRSNGSLVVDLGHSSSPVKPSSASYINVAESSTRPLLRTLPQTPESTRRERTLLCGSIEISHPAHDVIFLNLAKAK